MCLCLRQEALSAGVRQVCPRANVLTEEGVRQAVAAGLSVRAWGVKDLQVRAVRSVGWEAWMGGYQAGKGRLGGLDAAGIADVWAGGRYGQ